MKKKRDCNEKGYRVWRAKVYKRDRNRCQFPGCKTGDKRINAHHIERYIDNPKLAEDVNNGITLCRTCHLHIQGREDEFVDMFKKAIQEKLRLAAMLMMGRYGEEEK